MHATAFLLCAEISGGDATGGDTNSGEPTSSKPTSSKPTGGESIGTEAPAVAPSVAAITARPIIIVRWAGALECRHYRLDSQHFLRITAGPVRGGIVEPPLSTLPLPPAR